MMMSRFGTKAEKFVVVMMIDDDDADSDGCGDADVRRFGMTTCTRARALIAFCAE
jgi:hypothetical protein